MQSKIIVQTFVVQSKTSVKSFAKQDFVQARWVQCHCNWFKANGAQQILDAKEDFYLNILGAKQHFYQENWVQSKTLFKYLSAKQDFCSKWLGAKQDFCS